MLQNRDLPRATVRKPSSNQQALTGAVKAPLDGLSPPKLGFGGLRASVRQAHLLTGFYR